MVSLHTLSLLAAFSTTAMAQLTYLSTSSVVPTPTPTASDLSSTSTPPATRTIAVGLEGHAFTPKETTANVGDIIKFNFYPGGHRVSRAEFGFPCIPYEYVNGNTEGFWTGVFNPQAILNPLEPGEPFPTESAKNGPMASPVPSGDNDNDNGGGGLTPGAIAGIAIGAAAVVVLAAVLLYLCGRRGGFDKAYRKSFAGAGRGNSMAEAASYNPKSPGGGGTVPGFGDGGVYGQFGQHGSPVVGGGGGYHAGMGSSPPGSAQPGYVSQQHTGFSEGSYGLGHRSAHASPQPGYLPPFGYTPPPPPPVPAPAELDSGGGQGVTGSPPPRYPEGDTWGRK
uniref:Extracellular serine-rich protein n=1 Tax=Podospora anserina (strain S / ATCC MYA-4624 / DSM 980 / FGSC 10383) TaxID=515849 RepID=A0A090CDF6_PODAN|nr:Putative protein of unknown function [Podospora anserina S mat+]